MLSSLAARRLRLMRAPLRSFPRMATGTRLFSSATPAGSAGAASAPPDLVTMQCPVPIPADAQRALDALREAAELHCPGLELRVAGGWVRDQIGRAHV